MAVAYPYIRFSTTSQALGGSYERQTTRINEWAGRMGLTIDNSLELEDLGVSSFRGKHQKSGRLSEFLEKVKAGEIEKESCLLIENFDRLSRQIVIDSVQLFIDILKGGVWIAVLDENTIYKDAGIDFIRAVLQFERAHGESKRKSVLASAGWQKKHKDMEEGKIATTKCPHWLAVVDGKFVVDEAKASQINDLFNLSLTFGLSEATRQLNKKHGVEWKIYQSQYMLANRRVLGEHTAIIVNQDSGKKESSNKTFPDYYPAIISHALFDEVQKIISNRKPFNKEKGAKGKQDLTNSNILRQLVQCAHCGGTCRYMRKQTKEYYLCTRSMSGACIDKELKSIRGEGVKRALFRFEEHTRISAFLANSEQQVKTLNNDLAKLNAQLVDVQKKIDRLRAKALAENDANKESALSDQLADANGKKKEIVASMAEKQALIDEHTSLVSFGISERAEKMLDLLDSKTEEAVSQRAKLNRYLCSIFEKIEIDFVKKVIHSTPKAIYQKSFENPTGIPAVTTWVEIPQDKRFKKTTAEFQSKDVGKAPGISDPEAFGEEKHVYTGKDFLK